MQISSKMIVSLEAKKISQSSERNFVSSRQKGVISKLDTDITPKSGQALVYNEELDKYIPEFVIPQDEALGDMVKSIYDKDNDGIVDMAKTLEGLRVDSEALNLLFGIKSNVQDQIDNIKKGSTIIDSLIEIDPIIDGGNASTNYETGIAKANIKAGCIKVLDKDNNFKSTEKTVENILKELFTLINSGGASQKFLSHTFEQTISNTTITTIFDFSSIQGTLLNANIDIVNTSVDTVMTYQFLSASNIMYQGVIPIGKSISFETQRTDLVIKLMGSGNISVSYKYIL